MYMVQMNVVQPPAQRAQMMDQRINSVVYVKVLSEPMNFLLIGSASKEMGDHMRQGKNLGPRRESNV